MSHAPRSNAWRPTASIETLQLRADIIQRIRAFFVARQILEVDTPLRCHTSVTDPYIESINADGYYLQTSPEYAMKRLLAAGSGSIFQICKAFRQDEMGRLHNSEFTMIEWYRVGFDQLALMAEVDELLQHILHTAPAEKITYKDLYKQYFDIDITTVTNAQLQHIAKAHGIQLNDPDVDRDTWLNILMTHCIEPVIGQEKPCMIYNFPASQAALARINADDPTTAARFEVYFKGMELANGFHELQHAEEQRQRFIANNEKRRANQQKTLPLDELFLSALHAGLPDCSGVALGIDRLIMLALNKPSLGEVLTFSIENC